MRQMAYRVRSLFWVSFLLLGLSAPAPAWAQAVGGKADPAGVQRVGVVRLDFSGDVPEASRELFTARLVEGLAVARFEVLSGAAVRERLVAGNLGKCRDSGCYPAVAEALQVGYLVLGKVEESNKSYDIGIEIVNGRTGATVGGSRERCETCGITEAAEKMSLATASLRARLEAFASTPARFVIRSSPSGARATVDGKPVGTTPLDIELPGGAHRLVLQADRYDRLERSFTAVSGVDETLALDLVRLPSTLPLKALGWAGVLVGAALIGGGIYAALVDGDPIDCPVAQQDRLGQCPRVRDTDALATILAASGATALTLGGVAVWVASEQAPSTGSSPEAVASTGLRFGATLTGRF